MGVVPAPAALRHLPARQGSRPRRLQGSLGDEPPEPPAGLAVTGACRKSGKPLSLSAESQESLSHHHHIIIITLSPSHYNHHFITITLSSSHYHHHIIIITLSPSHYHHHIITITLSPSHYHHNIIIITLSPPSHYYHHHYTIVTITLSSTATQITQCMAGLQIHHG